MGKWGKDDGDGSSVGVLAEIIFFDEIPSLFLSLTSVSLS